MPRPTRAPTLAELADERHRRELALLTARRRHQGQARATARLLGATTALLRAELARTRPARRTTRRPEAAGPELFAGMP